MNKQPSTIFILIPVYNEAGNLPRLFTSLKKLSDEIKPDFQTRVVLIDDGSQDQTADLAEKSPLGPDFVVLRHEHNRGPGRAFATGFTYVAEKYRDMDFILTMEGDNTSRVELIKQMLVRIEEGFDVILASPYMYGGKIEHTNTFRVFLSSMANLFVKELLGISGIFTVSSFFRLYRAGAVKKLQSRYGPGIVERDGFECMTEMIMKMAMLQMRISEIAMVLDTALRSGKSKMKILRTSRGYLVLLSLKQKWLRMSARSI